MKTSPRFVLSFDHVDREQRNKQCALYREATQKRLHVFGFMCKYQGFHSGDVIFFLPPYLISRLVGRELQNSVVPYDSAYNDPTVFGDLHTA